MNRLFDVCQWDFLSYEQALELSPDKSNRLRYWKSENPSSLLELEISTELFGFYSWLPKNANDIALVKEYKTKPKLWTTFRVPQDEAADVQRISTTVELLLKQYYENAGVSCSGKRPDGWEFLVGLARRTSIPARYSFFM